MKSAECHRARWAHRKGNPHRRSATEPQGRWTSLLGAVSQLLAVPALVAGSLLSCTTKPEVLGPLYLTDHAEEAVLSGEQGARLQASALLRPITLSHETRLSLTPPVSSKLTFSVRVPAQPLLRFGTGVLLPKGDVLPARLEFRIFAEASSGRTKVFSHTLRRYEPNTWFDHEVDLSAWAGKTIKLSFEIHPQPLRSERVVEPASWATDGITPSWGNPAVSSAAGSTVPSKLILISLDCVRADHIGALGYPRNTTPRLDTLAEIANVFDTAVSSAPETLPSHTSMLTGLTPSFHGATKWRKLGRSVPYLPELLTKAGFETDAIVTGAFLSQSFGFERGFRRYRFLDRPGAKVTVDAALELLRSAKERDQFLLLHLFDAHWPYAPPGELIEKFGPRPTDISSLLANVAQQDNPPRRPEEIQQVIDLYDAEIAYMDRELGRFFDELEALGLFDNALIIVVGDHGEAFREHGWWQHTFTLYEEMVRIPFIVKWPGNAPRGRSHALVTHTDIFPTLLEAAGISPPASGGRDLRTLGLPGAEPHLERLVASEGSWRIGDSFFKKIAFRSAGLKYIASLEGSPEDELSSLEIRQEELYDLEKDHGEKVNLLDAASEKAAPYRRRLRTYLEDAEKLRERRRGEEVVLDEEVEKRLRALGYVR